MAVLWVGGCNDDAGFTAQSLAASGMPVFRNTLACVKAIAAAANYGKYCANLAQCTVLQRPTGIDVDAARALVKKSNGTLTERASKQVLAAYGFPVTRETLAKTADAAVSAAYNDVMAAAKKYKPAAQLDGVLVQEMAPAGLEIMLGLVSDPVFGAVVVAGLGGIHIEVLHDVVYRVAPIDHSEARTMLDELRGRKLLDGVRGTAARDIDALCDLIVRLSWLGHDLADEIAELDVNPLILREAGAGAIVVDALVVRRS
jgi:acetyltransferase